MEKGGVNRARNGGVAPSTVFPAEVSTAGGVIYLLVIYSTFLARAHGIQDRVKS